MPHPSRLTIGALAKAAGVTTPTIRYYEEIGLLPPAGRTGSGQRTYDATDVERVSFIRRCRDFGFPIEQVRLLAGLSISPDRDCAEARDIARDHLAQVQERLAELRALERNLTTFVTRCNAACSGGAAMDCVIFSDMAQPAPGRC